MLKKNVYKDELIATGIALVGVAVVAWFTGLPFWLMASAILIGSVLVIGVKRLNRS